MTVKQFREIQAKGAEWLKNYKANSRKKLRNWQCPSCTGNNETPAPTKALIAPGRNGWGGTKMCIHCGASSYVFIPMKGAATVDGPVTKPILKHVEKFINTGIAYPSGLANK